MANIVTIISYVLLAVFLFLLLLYIIKQNSKRIVLCSVAEFLGLLLLWFSSHDRSLIVFWLIVACCISGLFWSIYLIMSLIHKRGIKRPVLGVIISIAVFLCVFAVDSFIESNAAKHVDKVEFAESCIEIDYDECLRTPKKYKNQKVRISGTVAQVIETKGSTILLIDTTNGTWYVAYDRPENEPRLLENDYIIGYGVCDGVTSYKATNGVQVTIPGMKMVFYNSMATKN